VAKKKPKGKAIAVAGAIVITALPDGSFGFEVESDLSPEVLAAVLKEATAAIEGKIDRASGAWGR
jgi:hypothetical protein